MVRPTLLILAAGMGSRYGGLKQIDSVGPDGETIMDYSIHDALRAGFEKFVFVIRRDIEESFRQSIGARFEKRILVQYVFQEMSEPLAGFSTPPGRAKPWGTGHAILMADGIVNEPFAAINADDFYGANSFRALAEHLRRDGDDYAMVGFKLRNTLSEFGTVARGVCRTAEDDYLESVTELTRIERNGAGAKYMDAAGMVHALSGQETVSMNFWGFTPAVFQQLRELFMIFLGKSQQEEKSEFYIPMAVNELVQAKRARCKVLRTSDLWFGVTYRDDRPRTVESIRRLIAQGDYPEKLWT
ncbi:MAG TPA: sugar phosphate nucleotidyltransferase [Verrucomicrobiae bacterium]